MRSMTPWLVSLALVQTGCAFEPGDPWGVAAFELDARFDDAGRGDGDGRLRTSRDYRVQVDEVDVTLLSVALELAGADEASGFDPANPPPGYSLCHNGHCHADDGRLVDYEEIAVESGGGGARVANAIDASIALSDVAVPVPLGECDDGCRVPRGRLNAVSLEIASLRVEGVAFDTREPSRLPTDGVAFVVHGAGGRLSVPIEGTVDDDSPLALDLPISWVVSATLFDEVDFAEQPVSEPLDLTDHFGLTTPGKLN